LKESLVKLNYRFELTDISKYLVILSSIYKSVPNLLSMLKANHIVEIKPWKGHGGVFSWLTFVNNFENKLTLIEREYLAEKKPRK
jgi:hypothetical protein